MKTRQHQSWALILFFSLMSPVWASQSSLAFNEVETMRRPEVSLHTLTEKRNIEVVRKMHSDFMHGNMESLLSPISQHVDWQVFGPKKIPFSGNFQGFAGVAEFFKRLNHSQKLIHLKIDKIIADEKDLVVLGKFSFQALPTHKKYQTPFAHVFRLNDQGQVVKFRGYTDTDAAAKAFRP